MLSVRRITNILGGGGGGWIFYIGMQYFREYTEHPVTRLHWQKSSKTE